MSTRPNAPSDGPRPTGQPDPLSRLASALLAEASVFHREGRLEEAISAYRQVLVQDKECHEAWYAQGCAYEARGDDALAMECLQRAVELRPRHGESQHNLGKVLYKLGLVDEAMDRFRCAMGLGHGFLPRSALATVIPGAPGADNQAVLEARQDFARHHLTTVNRARKWERTPLSGRRLKVGYLSSYFHSPNWMKPVWGLIHHHNRAEIEVHIFSRVAAERCPGAERLIGGDVFHDISHLTGEAIYHQLEKAQLDILVDLNGYSCLPMLPVVAARPAPIVVGWFNLFATSGISAYDYIIGDSEVIPEAEERFYTEKVLRLPGSYLAFEVNHPTPEVSVPPMAMTGTLTFGSLASQYKITPGVVEAWSQILRRATGARLLVKNASLGSAANAAYLRRRFEACGVAPERIQLEGPASHFDFLATYTRVDVALDPFPYNGGTTTEEALWQGVPVLSVRGDRWAARQGASILRAAGLEDFVAATVDDYVSIAVGLATSPLSLGRLETCRQGMRARLRNSALCDTAGLARSMERLYAEIWATWWGGH